MLLKPLFNAFTLDWVSWRDDRANFIIGGWLIQIAFIFDSEFADVALFAIALRWPAMMAVCFQAPLTALVAY